MSAPIERGYRGLLPRVSQGDPHPLPTYALGIDLDKLVERSVRVALGEAKLAALAAINAVNARAPGTREWEDKHRDGKAVKAEILSAVEAVFK